MFRFHRVPATMLIAAILVTGVALPVQAELPLRKKNGGDVVMASFRLRNNLVDCPHDGLVTATGSEGYLASNRAVKNRGDGVHVQPVTACCRVGAPRAVPWPRSPRSQVLRRESGRGSGMGLAELLDLVSTIARGGRPPLRRAGGPLRRRAPAHLVLARVDVRESRVRPP